MFVFQDVSKYLLGEDAIDLLLDVILNAKSLRKLVRLIFENFLNVYLGPHSPMLIADISTVRKVVDTKVLSALFVYSKDSCWHSHKL